MRRNRWLAILVSLALVLTLLPGVALGASGSRVPFWDVIGGGYEGPVQALYDIGVVGGTSATTYSPGASVTRAQMAALIVRSLNLSDAAKGSFAPRFADLHPDYWAFGNVMLAEQMGIVRGVSTTSFEPESTVTYGQAAVMVLRGLGYDNGSLSYPSGYVLLADQLGLLKGLRWDLNSPMSRGEVAVLLANAVFLVKHKTYGATLSQLYFKRAISQEIRPTDNAIGAGTVKLQLVGKDAYGQDLTGLSARWSITGGSASVTEDGTLTVTRGPITVSATAGGETVTRTYDVISRLAITPGDTAAAPSDEIQLKAVDADRTDRTVTGATWSVKSGPGRVTADGKLTFTGSGTVSVQATLGTLTATATYRVMTGLTVVSPAAMVSVGEKVKLQVKGPDGTPFTGHVDWSLSGTGTLTQDGTYVAGSGSAPVITAKAGSLTGSLSLKVLNRLEVTPSMGASLSANGTQQFAARGILTNGDPVDLPVEWSWTGDMGLIGKTGLFVATNPGTGKVTASYGRLQQSVPVTVSGEAYMVVVTADRVSVPANGHSPVTLTATVKDSRNITVNTATPIQFSISDATKGALSQSVVRTVGGVATTTFTPGTGVGTARVTAYATDLTIIAGTYDVSMTLPVISRIRLSAYPNPVAAALNSRSTITASLIDGEGYEVPNNTGTTQVVNLSFGNPTSGSLSTSQILIGPNQASGTAVFNAGTAGNTVIRGTGSYMVNDLTVTTVPVGPAAKIVLRPGITDTKADGTSVMTVQAELQDANGVVLTQNYGTVVQLAALADDGVTTLPARVASTQAGVATFSITSTTAGNFTLTASAVSLASSTAQAKFIPGPASALRLSVEPTGSIAADGISVVRLRTKIVDANGNAVPTADGTVSFIRLSGTATALPAVTRVTAVNGVAELPITATVYPGTDTFKATMTGLADSGIATVTSNITGVPAKVTTETALSSTQVGGTVQVKVYLRDSRNQIVTSANGVQLRLAASSPTATITGSGLTESGVASFTVSDTHTGTVTLTATGERVQVDSSKSVTFYAGNVAKVDLKLNGNEMSADGGQSYVQLTAEAQDAYGNPLSSTVPITLNMSQSGVVSLSGNMLYPGNSILVRSTNLPGTVTITGSASIPVTPVSVSTFVNAAPAKVIVDAQTTGPAGTSINFYARLVDANGHAVTWLTTGSQASSVGMMIGGTAGTTTTITNSSNYGLGSFMGNGVNYGTAPLSHGVATFAFRNTRAETVTATPVFYYNGQPLPVQAGVITTTSGAPSRMILSVGKTGLSAATPDYTQLTASIVDIYGNPIVTTTPDTFNFSFSTTAYVTTADSTSPMTNTGSASILVTSKVHDIGGSTTITVTSTQSGLSSMATIVTDRPPGMPTIWATDATGTDAVLTPDESAARVVVRVDPRYSAQSLTVYVNGSRVTVYDSATGSTQITSIVPGESTVVVYIRRSDMGGPGYKTIQAMVQNAVAPSPMSAQQTITVQ